MEKFTKKDNFLALRNCIVEHADLFNESERLISFIDHELEQLSKRADDAKKYAKKTSKASDELSTAISAILMDATEPMIISDIMAVLPTELNATPQKLTYRLSKMVEANVVTKEQKSIKEDGKSTRKINAYSWIKIVEE